MTGTPEGVGAHRDPPRYLRDGDLVEVRVNDERLTNPVRRRGRPTATPRAISSSSLRPGPPSGGWWAKKAASALSKRCS